MDKKRIKLLLISIILVVTIGLSTRSIYFSQPKHKATKQAENFINLLIEGRNDDAYGITTKDLQDIETKSKFNKKTDGIKYLSKSYEVVDSIKTDDDNYTVAVLAGLPDATPILLGIKVTNEGNNWRISSLRTLDKNLNDENV